MVKKIHHRLKEIWNTLGHLNLQDAIDRLKENRRLAKARRHARGQLHHERDRKLDALHKLEKDPNPSDHQKERIHDLEIEIRRTDARIGDLNSRISRFTERAQELVPKVTHRQKRKHALLKKVRELRKRLKHHRQQAQQQQQQSGGLIVTFDGIPVAGWIARNVLAPARASGSWTGVCISGVRTVQHSIELCRAICGQDSCPGTCAGALTNHTCPPTHTCKEPEGAADCTMPAGLDAWSQAHGNPVIGNGRRLPYDVNHFSREGN